MLDTNRYKDFCSGEETIKSAVLSSTLITLPFVVVGELRAGFSCGSRARKNEAVLTRFLGQSCVTIAYATEDTTHHYAGLFKQLREQGTPIPTNDIWIAALAIQHDMVLGTRDKHFTHLPQIPIK
ncbi:MAG: PIN domain-containing protein [Planctomycetota bacterium]|jgi:tRNA(fMet)-specific endonuclease VapC